MSKLCLSFQSLASRTWEYLKKSRHYKISLREDAITSLNLIELYVHRSPNFYVIDFSALEESFNTGADWEWWFLQKGNHFRAAVQAKKLTNSFRYDIGYTPEGSKYSQIRRLFDYCSMRDLSPMYCFYNYWEPSDNVVYNWPCRCIVQNLSLFGCALTDGYVVQKLYSCKHHHIHDILAFSYPWHCIVCCEHLKEGGGIPFGPAYRALSIMQHLTAFNKLVNDKYPINPDYHKFKAPKLHKKLPGYMRELIDRHRKNVAIDKDFLVKNWGDVIPKRVVIQGNLNLDTE